MTRAGSTQPQATTLDPVAEDDERHRASFGEIAQGFGTLARLTGSKLPLDRALEVFERVAPHHWRSRAPGIRAALRAGRSLASAFDAAGVDVPVDLRGILMAGERSGRLAASLLLASQIAGQRAERRTRIGNALAYPAFLTITGLAAVGFLILAVIPRFAALLAEMESTVPPTTATLLQAAIWLRTHTTELALGLASSACAVLLIARQPLLKPWRDEWVLRLPLTGDLVARESSARASLVLAAQLDAGVPFVTALSAVRQTVANAQLQRRVDDARALVLSGVSPSNAIAATHALSDTAVTYVRVGENSGQLAEMLRESASLDQTRVLRTIERTVRLMEPTMVLLIGGVVALVASVLLHAMYTLRASL
jgi:type II secretory pathway component PulF